MNNQYALGILLVLSSVIITAVSQTMLKKAAMKEYHPAWRQYLSPFLIAGYSFFLGTTILNIVALRFIPMILCAALGTTAQIAVPIAGHLFLKEKITKRRAIGMILVAVGALIACL